MEALVVSQENYSRKSEASMTRIPAGAESLPTEFPNNERKIVN